MIVKKESNGSVRQLCYTIAGSQGKQKKLFINNKASTATDGCQSPSCAATRDGSVVLKIVKQPEAQHRARYLTEGSRGSVKDTSGSGFPTIAIEGYTKPTKLQIFVGTETGKPLPHLFYQVCRVAGKSPVTCLETRVNGTNILELSSEHRRGNIYICDCVGILKERFSDVEGRFPNDSAWKEAKRKSTHCRLVFKTTVENKSGNLETLQVTSDLINCTQLPGTPEILKMNTKTSPMGGGGELWIIGKNFLKDTKVNFFYVKPGKEEPTWSRLVNPIKEFFHPNHLIVKIPAFSSVLYHEMQCNVVVRSSGKTSDSVTFTYTPDPAIMSAAALANDTGKISVIRSVKSMKTPSCKPTILEPVDQHDRKRARVDTVPRRTQSSPRLHDINNYRSRNNQSLSPWRTHLPLSRRDSFGENTSRSSEDSSNNVPSNSNATNSNNMEETKFSLPGQDELTSNLTMDFTEFFKTKRNELQCQTASDANFTGVIQPAPKSSSQPVTQLEIISPKSETISPPTTSASSVTVGETSEDKATIAISLPTSILKDQVHMKNIMETLNTTFYKKESDPLQQSVGRKRGYAEYEEPVELPCVEAILSSGDTDENKPEDQDCWNTEELKSIEDKKWNEDINEILETVMEEPINFVSM